MEVFQFDNGLQMIREYIYVSEKYNEESRKVFVNVEDHVVDWEFLLF